MPNPDGSPQWPEVVELINDTRADLSGQIKDLGSKMDQWIVPTENRLTIVEQAQAGQAREVAEHRAKLDDHAQALLALRLRHENDERAQEAVNRANERQGLRHQVRLSWWQWVVTTILGLLVAVPAVLEAIHLIVG